MSEQPEQMQTGPSGAQAAVDWVLTNKLRAIGYTWLTGIGGTLVRNPMQCTSAQQVPLGLPLLTLDCVPHCTAGVPVVQARVDLC